MRRDPPATLLAALLAAVACAAPAAAAPPAFAQAAGPATSRLPLASDARAAYLERCSAEHRRNYPQMVAAAVDSSCTYRWDKVEAAGPLADLVLAAVPARPGERFSAVALRARLPGSSWDARPSQGGPSPPVATGRVGGFKAAVAGTGAAVTSLILGWSEVGADTPYDLPGALAARGARVEPLGCYHYGVVEVNAAYVIEAPGRAPFAVTIYSRGAPFAQSTAAQSFEVGLDGVLPTKAGLRAEYRDPAWVAPCPV